MHTTTLGRSGVAVTTLGLGTAPLGNLYAPVGDDVAAATLVRAWDRGIRFFDTAPHYGLGLAERRLGAVLRLRPAGPVVSTKVGRLLVPGPGVGDDLEAGFAVPADHHRVWDLTADGVRRSLLDSLNRTGLDRVEIALLHDPDGLEEQAVATALPALLAMRDEGVVGAVGVGMNQSAMPARLVRRFDLDVVLVAGRFTLLDRGALTDLFPAASERGTSVVVGGVFGSGLLAHDDPPDGATYGYAAAPAALLERARRIAAVCREHGTTLPAAALHFSLDHPVVASAVIGMRTPEEVDRNVALLDRQVPEDLWDDLHERGLLDRPAAGPRA